MDEVHSCSYYCQIPACIKAQRDAMRDKYVVDDSLGKHYDMGWNAALDEAIERIGEINAFGKATQDSFSVYIKKIGK
jgi:hypothetical protein